MFICMFTIPRVVGWLAHWIEFLNDSENNIIRPRQNYVGNSTRDYVPIDSRTESNAFFLDSYKSVLSKRRET